MFKNTFCIIAFICATVLNSHSVNAQRSCGTLHPMSDNSIQDPGVEKRYQEFEKRIRNNTLHKSSNAVVVIPVVFHIVHNGDAIGSNENISETYITAQLEQLNDDFRRLNADSDNTWSQAADTEIEFCLANIDTLGNPTSGIVRHNIQGGPWTPATFDAGVKPQTIWNRDEYLNVWSAELSDDLLGYAQFPGEDASTDGVVCLDVSFGSLDTPHPNGAPFNIGRTLTHEVGHWLGLFHIWGDVVGCSGTDEVADTPNQEDSSSGCPSGVKTDACSANAPGYMYQNYMDYSNDACMNLFTSGQMTRMKAAIMEYRSGLNATKCSNPGPLEANFSPSSGPIEVCPDGQIQFFDLSIGDINARSWTFSGAGVTPVSSSVKNPIVEVTTSGTLSVYLLVNDNIETSDTLLNIPVTVLDGSSPSCAPPPCLDFASDGGPYADLYYGDGAFTNCTVLEVGFEVYSSEAYILSGLLAGTTYTLDFCDGYDANLWDAVITIGKYDLDNNNAEPNSEIANANNCSITFTPTVSDDYLAVISTADNCNAVLDDRENGWLTFTCVNSPTELCNLTFTDNGGENNNYTIDQNKIYTLCPNDMSCEKISLDFSEFDLEIAPNCTSDYMIIYSGTGGEKEIIDTYCGSSSPGTIISASSSGCLTIEFVSDGVTSYSKGWVAAVGCLDDGNCQNECPAGYSLSGSEIGNGGPMNSGEYRTDGIIFSIQDISTGNVIYDAQNAILLSQEFQVNTNTSFSVFLDGCVTGSNSKK